MFISTLVGEKAQ